MTEGYAPFGVFFEGWKSSPRESIETYEWDFGDGSEIFTGFNAAHVYENPGTYPVTLTVTDQGGATATATTTITVMARDGRTFYVDAQTGDDANDGLSETTAWRTATYAFLGMSNLRYGPGDQILFKRGQTFDLSGGQITISWNKTGYGYMFGAFGEGAKPVCQYIDFLAAGESKPNFITMNGGGAAHITISDLEFRLRNPQDESSYIELFMDLRNQAHSILFHRVDWRNVHKVVSLTGNVTAGQISNVIYNECTAQDGRWVMFYHKASRVASIGCHFDLTRNHIWYGAWTDVGVWSGNIFTRASFGRVALRLAAASNSYDFPTNNVYVGGNYFGGHIDPIVQTGVSNSPHGNGTRYNYELLYLAPNVPETQAMEDVLFEKNVLSNGEQAILIGDFHRLTIRDNLFTTAADYVASYRINVGHVFDRRPMKDIFIQDNIFYSYQNRSNGAGVIRVHTWEREPYLNQAQHENIVITGNEFYMQGGNDPVVMIEGLDQNLYDAVTIDDNIYYKPSEDRHAQTTGTFQGPTTGGKYFTLEEWRVEMGKDLNSTVLPAVATPFPGQAFSPATAYGSEITVEYGAAVDYEGGQIPEVNLWMMEKGGSWTNLGTAGPGPSGSMTVAMPGPGTYYFATSTVNSGGISSLLPTDYPVQLGSTRTIVLGETAAEAGTIEPPEPDTTPPSAGTASAPATASAGPIRVTYSGASDTGGSGIQEVKLWVKQNTGGAWENTGLTSTGTSGLFDFPVSADATYFFDLQAVDGQGNSSAAPSSSGDTNTVYAYVGPEKKILVDIRLNDESTDGLATDESGAGNNGTLTGTSAPTFVSGGQVDGAYDFDGNDHIDLGALDVDGTGLTLAAFVFTRSKQGTDHANRIITKSSSSAVADTTWNFSPYNSGGTKISFRLMTDNGVSHALLAGNGGILNLGAWHHVAATFDGSMMRLYKDGAVVGTKPVTGKVAMDASKPVWIGNLPTTAGNGWDGLIDEVKIYDFALTDTEIQTLAGGGHVTGTTPPPPPPSDTTAPIAGEVTAPLVSNATPIALTFSGATDEDGGSGLKMVSLWVRKGSGAWSDTGQTSTLSSGTFNFSTTSGDDTYSFALVAEDNDGNVSATPTGAGSASIIYDTIAPGTGEVALAAYSTSPIAVNFANASDSGGSGVNASALWFRKGTGGAWTNSGLTAAGDSGTILFTGVSGDDTYFFGLQTADTAGNVSPAPSGSGQANTIVDTSPPDSGKLTASTETSSSTPIGLTYANVADLGSGVKEVTLWAKKDTGGAWTSTGQVSVADADTFAYAAMTGDGTYFFALRVEDNAGNFSPIPKGVGDTNTVYDTADPSTGTLSGPGEYTSSSPITLNYSGATDAGSGLQDVRLWANKDSSGWADTGLTQSTEAGSFSYFASQGDGSYEFSLEVTDTIGNSSGTPTGAGQASVTYDVTAPTVGSVTGPDSANAGPVTLNYAGGSDDGSGLKEVVLWVRKPNSAWIESGLTATSGSGTVDFNDFTTDGSYQFAVQAEDNAGNTSAAPSGLGSLGLTFDGTAPTAPTVTAPTRVSSSPITVSYTGASDQGSGVSLLTLWSKKGTAGPWASTGMTSPSDAGSFDYAGVTDDETYYFAVQVEDEAGNKSADPSGNGQANTIYDTSAPPLATATAAEFASDVPVAINYTGDGDVETAHLWMRKGSGPWADTGLTQPGSSGTFNFSAFTGDDTYYWAVKSEDSSGNQSDDPAGDGSASTQFDTAKPTAATASASTPVGASPITVNFAGASDDGSGLESVTLWVKKNSGAWTASGLTDSAAAGAFSYAGATDDGRYHFATQATDKAGNTSTAPSANGDVTVTYDTEAPNAGAASSTASASTSPIQVSYAGANDSGSGLKSVELWVRIGAGPWQGSGQTSADPSGSFSYAVAGGDETYYFALKATDNLDVASADPSGNGDTNTVYDATPPSGAAASAPQYASATPIAVSYSGSGDIANAHLWFKKGTGGTWANSGLTIAASSGSFDFTGVTGDETYFFDVQTEDSAENTSPEPTGGGSASTIYDATAPTGGVVTAAANADSAPIAVNYSGVSDPGAGVNEVQLWSKKDAGAWADTGQVASGDAGSFAFSGVSGDGTYSFALLASDNAGNAMAAPAGDGLANTVYDSAPPTLGTLTAPAMTATGPITVTYAGVSDDGAGVAEVSLWVKKGAGAWRATGMVLATDSGSFDFADLTSDATYEFALQAEDSVGNKSPEPAGAGAASTIYDATAPAAAGLTLPQYATSSPINVAYVSADDGGSGFKSASLWARKGGGAWGDTGQTSTDASGSFSYTGASGDDTYAFYVRAEDNAGNMSSAPAGSGGGSTIFDTTAPDTGSLTAPEFDVSSPIELTYQGVNDPTSGVKSVALWAQKDSGPWQATGVESSATAGSLNFSGATGDGTYNFALVATDQAGNTTPNPSGGGSASTAYDTTAPDAGTVTAPEYASTNPVTVTYSGVSDGGSALELVTLYVKKNSGSWTSANLTSTDASGSFDYTVSTGDGTYAFALRTKDKAGNESPLPSGQGDARTAYDTADPSAGTLTAPEFASSGSATITYTGASDSGSGLESVALYMRKDAGAWADTGMSSPDSSGSFSFGAFTGDGTYYFATRAEDKSGTQSAEPTGDGGGSTIYDTTAPTTGSISAPPQDDGPPISILYSGLTDTGGSGVDTVELWARKGTGGAWANSGQAAVGPSGSFAYDQMSGNDTYFFALVASDKAGNQSGAPTGDGQANTVLDMTFTAGTATAPEYATESPIAVTYAGAEEPAAGTLTIHLWAKSAQDDTWADTGMTATGGSGQFLYEPAADDTYYFAVQAENDTGDFSSEPFGNGDTSTLYDTTAPAPLTLTSQDATNVTPLDVTYEGVVDSGSGVKQVQLWVKRGIDGIWEDTGLVKAETEGVFAFDTQAVEDTYFFYLQVEDNAGHTSDIPTDALVFGTEAEATAFTDQLAADIKFDDDGADGVAIDSSDLGNNGSFAGASAPTPTASGRVSGAYDFDGDDHVDLGGLDVDGKGITVSAFVFMRSYMTPNRDNRIVTKGTTAQDTDTIWNLSPWKSGGTRLSFRLMTDDGVSHPLMATNAGLLSLNTWHHVAATYDGATITLYRDGQFAGSTPATGKVAMDPTVPVWIGDLPAGGGKGWDGFIDEVKIYDFGLTAEEIQTLSGGGHVASR
jgi:hypothetical protein